MDTITLIVNNIEDVGSLERKINIEHADYVIFYSIVSEFFDMAMTFEELKTVHMLNNQKLTKKILNYDYDAEEDYPEDIYEDITIRDLFPRDYEVTSIGFISNNKFEINWAT